MKFNFVKQAIVLCILACTAITVNAQFTETFENQTAKASTFTSSGQTFNLTGAFKIFSSRFSAGYDHSSRFIDNVSNTVIGQTNSITSAKPFKLNNLWLFVSSNGGNDISTNGTVTFTGKLNGVLVFTFTKTTGFIIDYGPVDNGFNFINFATEGGADYTSLDINQLDFTIGGSFDYLAIDNFTFIPSVVLPLSLVSYSATLQLSGTVSLNWQTASESNTSHFMIERSNNGIHFQSIAEVKAAGNSNVTTNYNITDANPLDGVNYYRLVSYDIDGKVKQLGIKAVNVTSSFTASIYPNPAVGGTVTLKSALSGKGIFYVMSDMAGKIVKTGIISNNVQTVDISQLVRGSYMMKLSDGQLIRLLKN